MLTFFTTAKPFRGHNDVIQRNALKSWTLLDPDVQVILFGDDEGAAEVAAELGIWHESQVERTEFGAMRLDSMFGKAQVIARHELLCYVNCDIILLGDFRRAIERVREKYRRFLMIGRRWDAPITEPVDFSDPSWEHNIRAFALSTNQQRGEWWIDYFAFSRGTFGSDIRPLGIGRYWWDHWLVARALDLKSTVVDASRVVIAVHQNHDYNHHPKGWYGVSQGEEPQRNLGLAGGRKYLRYIAHATREFAPNGQIRSTWVRRTRWEMERMRENIALRLWYPLLNSTYSLRHAVGLNRKGISHSRAKLGK